MIKLTLYCDKCDKEWDRQAGIINLNDMHVTCKECQEAEKTEAVEAEVTPETPEESV